MRVSPIGKVISYNNKYYLCYEPIIKTKWDKIKYHIRYIIACKRRKKADIIIKLCDDKNTNYIVMKLMK